MLVELLESGYGNDQNLNCAQKILFGANKVYELGLSEESLKLSGGFGGGMGIESTCGALTAGVMVLSYLYPAKDIESKKNLYNLTKKYLEAYKDKMNHIDCAPLKNDHRTVELGCHDVIIESARILDKMLKEKDAS